MKPSLTTRREPEKVRLIDANALLKSLDKQWMRDSYLNNERAELIRQVMNAVHLAPTVDTAELNK